MTAVECAVESRDLLGETPLWCDRTKKLYWLDIDNTTIQRFDPQSGTHERFPLNGDFLGSLSLRSNGELLIAIDGDLYTYVPGNGIPKPFCAVEPTGLDTRLNDGRADARGRFWVGSMDNQLSRPVGSFYRIDPDGTVTRQFGDIIVSNTVTFSPDQKTLYFCDTRRFIIWAFDLDIDDGVLTNRRVFADFTSTGERPDGACVDSDGCIWNAIFAGGRIVRFTPDGRIDTSIAVPVTNPTCVCFGGDDLRTLYVTTARKFLPPEQLAIEPLAGAVLAVTTGAQGLTEFRFGE